MKSEKTHSIKSTFIIVTLGASLAVSLGFSAWKIHSLHQAGLRTAQAASQWGDFSEWFFKDEMKKQEAIRELLTSPYSGEASLFIGQVLEATDKNKETFEDGVQQHQALAQKLNETISPKAFSRSLVFVFGTVLFTGLLGISCLFFLYRARKDTNARLEHALQEKSLRTEEEAQVIAEQLANLDRISLERSSALRTFTSTVEQLRASVESDDGRAQDIASAIHESLSKADESKRIASEMLGSVGEIKTSTQSILDEVNAGNERIAKIVSMIKDIGSKTRVIDEIVSQTRILSFNASVEAARAGEHGKGFAVVAEEVGKLAQMSGKASQEIASLLQVSVQEVDSIVERTKNKVEELFGDSQRKMIDGERIAKDCDQSLQELSQAIASLAETSDAFASTRLEYSRTTSTLSEGFETLARLSEDDAEYIDRATRSLETLIEQKGALPVAPQPVRVSNVVPLRKVEKPSEKAVTPAPSQNSSPEPAPLAFTEDFDRPEKAVVGGTSTPSRDDSRFEDL